MVLILERRGIRAEMLVLGPLSTNAYLLINYDGRALLIDAPPNILTKVLYMIDRGFIRLTHVLITHAHFDHVAEAEPVKEASEAKLIMGRDDLIILNVSERWAKAFKVRWFKPVPDILLSEDSIIDLGWVKVYALHTPGHSPGSFCYYVSELGIVFTGDVLFKDNIGRTDLVGGSSIEMRRSLRKLALLLPRDVLVAPGHGEITTLRRELRLNPYIKSVLRRDSDVRL